MQPRNNGQQQKDQRRSTRPFWLRLVDPAVFMQKPERRQARLLSVSLLVLISLSLLTVGLSVVYSARLPSNQSVLERPTTYIAVFLIIAYVLNRRGQYFIAATISVSTLSLGLYASALTGGNVQSSITLLYLILPVLLASVLLSLRAALILFLVQIAAMLLLPTINSDYTPTLVIRAISFNAVISTVVLLAAQYRNMLEKDRQAWLNAILREMPAGITVQSPNGSLLYANDRAADLVGYPSAQEFINSPVTEVMQRFRLLDEAGQPFDVAKMPGRLALQGKTSQETIVRFMVLATGEERWSIISATPIVNETGKVEAAVNIFQDITRLKLTENTQRFLAESSAMMSTSLDYETTLRNVATQAVPTIADWVAIDILEAGKVKRLITVHSDPAKLELANDLARRYPTPADTPRGVSHVLRTGDSELYKDIPDEMLVAAAQNDEHLALIRSVGLKSAVVVPLIARGQILGAFSFVTAESGRRYDQTDLELVKELAGRAALAIDNAQLYRSAQLERERFAVTLSSIGDAVIATDTNSAVTFMNPVAEELTGWQTSDAMHRQLPEVFNIINEFTRQPVDDPTRRVLTEGVVVGLANHTILIARDGIERPIDDSGAPIKDDTGKLHGAVLVFRDITEQKRVESQQQFLSQLTTALSSTLDYDETLTTIARLTVPNIADWCTMAMLAENGIDLKHPVIAHSNPAKEERVQQILINASLTIDSKYPAAEALRTGQVKLIEGVSEDFFQAVGADQFTRTAVNELKISTSLCIPLMARGRKLGVLILNMAESGRQFSSEHISFAEDLGRRAALAVDNARLYKDVQAAVRFRDEFLSIAAHELRTPVTSLQGFAQLLLKRFEKSNTLDVNAVQRAMKVINEQTHKLTRLIAQLLDISRIQLGTLSLEKQVTDLSALVQSVASAAQMGTASHSINVVLEPAISALVDPIRIEQVLWNLLDNAIKYSPGGGAIQIALTTPAPDKLQIAVTDHGLGIPLEHKDRIFERSYQAHPEIRLGGLGLGLYISRQIVEQHGGKISHQPVPGGGTQFIATLPR